MSKLIKECFALFLLLILNSTMCFSQNQFNYVELNEKSVLNKIGQHVLIFEDHSNKLSFEQIISPKIQEEFVLSNKEVPSFGINEVTVWVKVILRNVTDKQLINYIEIAFPTLDSVFYFQNNELDPTWIQYFSSDRINFSKRVVPHKNVVFPLLISPQSITSVYFKIRNKGSIILPINIMPQPALYASDLAEELTFGIFYGIMLVMLLYNLLLAFTARSVSYIYYVGIIAGNLLTLSALNGHAFQYLWGDMPWWANHVIIFGIGLWILSGNLFAASFLDVRHQKKMTYHGFKLMQMVGFAVLISAFLIDYKYSLLFANIALITNCFFLLATGIIFRLLGVKVAGIFSFAWVLYLIGVLLYTLRNLGFLPVNDFTSHILEIGAISEVLLLSVSLGYKYRLLELDKKQAQQNSLDLMTQSQQIIQQQNEQLEIRIQERTLELQKKQQEVLKQNSTLNEQNKQLIEAQTIIKEQNNQLHIYNENLEQKVSQRTADLKDSNQELAQNVQKLEQYAYMTAHNLRAPVARLLGLTQLLEMDPSVDKNEWINILSKIRNEGISLDSVINDLNSILEIRQKKDHVTERVDLNIITDQIRRILRDTIEKNEVLLNIDFNSIDTLQSNVAYVKSILYNLISNAIKYSQPNRKAVIDIKGYKSGKYIILEVNDNGIGIDLERYGHDLFGMYKRFHTHIEGKGLGLFLVKSQVEILGGTIEIESKVGMGTRFKLIFP